MADININQVGNFNPNAHECTTNIYNTPYHHTRYSANLCRLTLEVENKITTDVIGDLLYYTTKLDATKSMEDILHAGGFSDGFIVEAKRKEEQYLKKAMEFGCYPAAQDINLFFFTSIIDAFGVYVKPTIRRGQPFEEVMERIHEKVVMPIMNEINENGEFDLNLHYTSDHIYGMIYYLTDMCHLIWQSDDKQ